MTIKNTLSPKKVNVMAKFKQFNAITLFVALTTLSYANTAVAFDLEPKLQEELLQAYKQRGAKYRPRTEHFNDDGTPTYINRLINEDSPYLLQHAHNPVNWYPWSKAAFEQAKLQGKPIFLSIGYATCHWCHVMERESFENEEIARLMNEKFIGIKVDREQLPDVDAMYMLGVQVTTGSGGWPLSAFLQPDGKLFHGATYMPPDIFTTTLERVDTVWQNDKPAITEFANSLATAIADNSNLAREAKKVGDAEIELAREDLLLSHDSFQGGFGPAPKFPRESTLLFLLDLAVRNQDKEALEAVDFSLVRMNAGGIHDHVGGGFHRYAVDNDWIIPHFEKMLYTQAGLLQAYLQAFELTGKKQHARTATRIADYVLREMTSEEGGFYSATDADSDGGEGRFFIWSKEELVEVLSDSLGAEEAEFAAAVWGVSEEGNFEERNILKLESTLEEVAAVFNIDEATLANRLNKYSKILLEHRNHRIPPLTDDKIITEWNAMMSTALIRAGFTLNEPRYTQAAVNSIEFVIENNLNTDGTLQRASFKGRSSTPGSQADYAFLAQSFVALYDTTGDKDWLNKAKKIVATMNENFWDDTENGYFMGRADPVGAALPTRPKDIFDNAGPTGNAVALKTLVQLWNRTGDEQYKTRAESLVAAFSEILANNGSGLGYFLIGTNDLLNGEVGAHRYVARGNVKVQASSPDGQTVEMKIDVAPGWHINSNEPIQDYLIPTELSAANGIKNVSYPTPVVRKLGFQRSKLSLLEGRVNINGTLTSTTPTAMTTVELQLQACNDEICLAPETLAFKIPLTQPN